MLHRAVHSTIFVARISNPMHSAMDGVRANDRMVHTLARMDGAFRQTSLRPNLLLHRSLPPCSSLPSQIVFLREQLTRGGCAWAFFLDSDAIFRMERHRLPVAAWLARLKQPVRGEGGREGGGRGRARVRVVRVRQTCRTAVQFHLPLLSRSRAVPNQPPHTWHRADGHLGAPPLPWAAHGVRRNCSGWS